MGHRDQAHQLSGLPLVVVVGHGSTPELTPEQRARFEAADKALDAVIDGLTVEGKFVVPGPDPDGFDRRMTGV